MKTCYISDLDGTLLDGSAQLTQYTKNALNTLTKHGVNITAATARSPYSVRKIFGGVNNALPMILMNGVMFYDNAKDEIISYNEISRDAAVQVIKTVKGFGITAFMYLISDKKLIVRHENIDTPYMYDFYRQRLVDYDKLFEYTEDLENAVENGIVYFTMLYDKCILEPICEAVSKIDGISCSFYNDIYSDMWYLEVFSDKATKYNGALRLKEQYGFDRLVAFGDSENDIPLFMAADVKLAVENGCESIKSMADKILSGSDCVVKYILGDAGIDLSEKM